MTQDNRRKRKKKKFGEERNSFIVILGVVFSYFSFDWGELKYFGVLQSGFTLESQIRKVGEVN